MCVMCACAGIVFKARVTLFVTGARPQDMVSNRKGSFDLYGLDFVLDEELNVWCAAPPVCVSGGLCVSVCARARVCVCVCE